VLSGKVTFEIQGINADAIQPVGVRIGKDGKKAYVALGPVNRVAIVDTATLRVEKYLLVGQRILRSLQTKNFSSRPMDHPMMCP
jgi:DNA-binding beta-propeller fold protein YncE